MAESQKVVTGMLCLVPTHFLFYSLFSVVSEKETDRLKTAFRIIEKCEISEVQQVPRFYKVIMHTGERGGA